MGKKLGKADLLHSLLLVGDIMPSRKNWRTALDRAGIDFPMGRIEANISCLFHSDKIPSLSINVEKGVWICHAGCGQGRLASLIAQYVGTTELEAETYAIDKDIVGVSKGTLFVEDNDAEEVETGYVGPILGAPYIVPRWALDRGFSKDTLREWQCSTYKGSLVIPVHNEYGILLGYISRQPNGYIPKYLYTKEMRKSRILFGHAKLNFEKSYVCLTEGPLDTMWLWQARFNSVALLGSWMSRRQENLLKALSMVEVVMCLDNDRVGRGAIDKIAKKLNNTMVVSHITLPKDCKDVQEVRDLGVLRDIIDKRLPIVF